MDDYVKNLPWNLGPFDWIPAAGAVHIDSSKSDSPVRPVGVTVYWTVEEFGEFCASLALTSSQILPSTNRLK